MPLVLRGLLGAVIGVAGVTAIALEGQEVVVVETRDAAGASRRTRTWIADDEGAAWIEAAAPERAFLIDLQRNPTLTLERAGLRHACRAWIAPNPEGHARIRRLLATRYGWADRWIGCFANTTRSVALRLECA